MDTGFFKKADFLQGVFDSVPSYLFVVDSDVRIFHFNAAAAKLLGDNSRTALLKRGGEAFHCIYSGESPEGCGRSIYCADCVIRSAVRKVFEGGRVYRETTKMKLADGENVMDVYLRITAGPMEYGGESFALLVMEDVSKEKEQEEMIRQHASRLERANCELEAFSFSVSHDLKAPLRSIDAFSNIIADEYASRLDPKGREYLLKVCDASRSMAQLIDDLLNFSRSTGEITRERIDMSAMAVEIAGWLNSTHTGRHVVFSIMPGLSVEADEKLLRIALNNLLGNAFKFTASSSEACIEVGQTTGNGKPAFYVKDNGAGFDMTYADKLFTPFERLHDTAQFPGSGIGLATVKRIVKRHGGRIWAEGEPGKGAVFYFTLG